MIIDFHTHIFPQKIASRTIEVLSEKGGIPPYTDGTQDSLIEKMEIAGTDISINLPVLTTPLQFDSVNKFAKEINECFKDADRKIISFAGIHPLCEQIDKKMKFIKESGFLGVKIHPDYQGAFITDEGYVKIVECAKEYDLIVVTHSGNDIAFRGTPTKCTPALAKDLIQKVHHKKMVFAHMGANELYEQVISTLAGEDVYFDTSFVLKTIEKETFVDILEKHGEDKMLFGSDSPWNDIKYDVEKIKSFALKKQTQDKLFYRNAEKLLGI